MFGKHFAQMYSGSMYGKPAIYFAVWGWIIAHQVPVRRLSKHTVEVNPSLLASTFNTTPSEIIRVLQEMCSPDPSSRSKEHEGRKLLYEDDGDLIIGPMTFIVVNGPKYRAILNDEERRAYLSEKKRESRSKRAFVNNVNNVNTGQQPSTQAEAETEVEEKKKSVAIAPTSKKAKSLDTQFTESWVQAFKEHFGYANVHQGGKDAKAVKRLLSIVDCNPLEVARCAWAKVGQKGFFHCQASATIAGLASRFNEIRVELTPVHAKHSTEASHQATWDDL